MDEQRDESTRRSPEEAPYGASSGGRSRRRPRTSRRYTAAEKKALLDGYKPGEETVRGYCDRHEITSSSLCLWRRQFAERGAAGLEPKHNPRNRQKTHRRYSPEERRAAVEAYSKSGRTLRDFSKVWGITSRTLSRWRAVYEQEGPKGLEPKPPAKRDGPPIRKRLPQPVVDEIVRTKRRFAHFGLRRVRDFLWRFQGVKVSTGTVCRVLRQEGISGLPAPEQRAYRKRPLPRRFERSRPGELWQSDITSFVLAGSGQRVYLTVYLDDFSRYIVSFGLKLQQRADLVIETLLLGIGRFGKPREVLTDQGRQYFAWRGKSAFQRLLLKEGIQHVVARARHPETVGKTERFWATVNREFWERVRPREISEARERLSHFIAHYNHFRPHQGIDGLVPADRFFQSEQAFRKTLEQQLSNNELEQALHQVARKPLYLFGQVGDQQVAIHGEKGRVVIQTPDGGRQELDLSELGIPGPRKGIEKGEQHAGIANRANPSGNAETAPEAPYGQEADGLPGAQAVSRAGQGAVGTGESRAEASSAPAVRGDAGVLAGADREGGGDGEAATPGAAGLAAVADGALGYAGGSASTTPVEARCKDADRSGRGPEEAQEAHPGAGRQAETDRGPGAHPARSAGKPACERDAGTTETGPTEQDGSGRKKKAGQATPGLFKRWLGRSSGSGSR